MALAVAESGADVLITAAREKSQLHDTVTASKGLRGTVRGILADVTDVSACKAVLAAAEQDMGGVDVLINNAGRGMRLVSETYTVEPVKLWETEPETWRTILTTRSCWPASKMRCSAISNAPAIQAAYRNRI